MPPTPEVRKGQDVSDVTSEYRKNALRNRKENDWFSHDDTGSRTPPPSRQTSGDDDGAARTWNRSLESEQWFRHDVNGSLPSPRNRPEPEMNADDDGAGTKKVLFVGRDPAPDWYRHGPDVPDPPSLDTKSKPRSRRGACSEVRQMASDPNDWFRHDHHHDRRTTVSGSREPVKVTASTALWVFVPDDGRGPAEPLVSTTRPGSRLTCPEADEYHRRDRQGTSAEWFSHEHPRNCTTSGGRRGANVRRPDRSRRGRESEDWFSHHHDNRNYVTPTPVVRGNSPLTRELIERGRGREIKQVFRMDENLPTIKDCPPPPPPAVPDELEESSSPATTHSSTTDSSDVTSCDVIR